MAFCDACGKNIEWHVTEAGRSMPIDQEATPAGRYRFNGRLRLVTATQEDRVEAATPGTKVKLYTSHFDTCAKRGQRPARAPFVCDEPGCDVAGAHRHCFRCKGTDHLARDCPDAE